MAFDFEVIRDSEAPRPPKPQSKIASDVLAMLNGLEKNQVARLKIPEGMSSKGIRISIGRIATNNGLKAQTWTVQEEDGIVYVKRV